MKNPGSGGSTHRACVRLWSSPGLWQVEELGEHPKFQGWGMCSPWAGLVVWASGTREAGVVLRRQFWLWVTSLGLAFLI